MPRAGYTRRLRPLEMLDEGQLASLHQAVLTVLEDTGVRFEDAWALDFLRGHGCRVDDAQMRVRFPRPLVDECMRQAPRQFTVRAPNPDNDLIMGGDVLVYSHTSGMQTIDLDTFEPKPASRAEYIDCIRVLQALPHLDHLGCYPYFGFAGLPDLLAIPAGVAIHMQYSDKHQMTACSNDCELFTLQMAQAAGHEIVGTIGVSPPLTWGTAAVTAARRVVEAGFPLTTVDGGMMGGTAPATAAGSAVVSTAEHLAMVVLVQLLHPGHRMIVGHFSAPLNMRTGSPAFGQIGASISNVMFNQLWCSYGIPLSNGSPGYVNAKKMDFQAGYEKGIAAFASALSGVNTMLLHLGVSSELSAHPVQAILDDDIAGMVGRFISGEEINADSIALDLIQEVGPIPGHYLNRSHTRKWWRKSQYMPQTADTLSYPEWLEGGKRAAVDYARERMAAILAEPEKRFLTCEQEQDLDRILAEAREYYRDRI